MTAQYVSPESITTEITKKRQFWKRVMSASIAGIVVPIAYGMLGTGIGMLGAFNELSESGGADPEVLAGEIGRSMSATAIGLSVAAVATACLVLSAIKLNALPKPLPQR